ncbi:zeta toxin family protein (plasmid) [Cereibacter azotoformans]|uniref:zeta toxin family protein n=1 Tax=Cereibacter azotoformans TaxID=43057 RepID=UPI001EEA54E1|nr:zeta toxin family protein [Cereibacter azotoformans]ULB12190.1 zeta toxin family protein [Cereibacter azotoformans]
MRPSLVLLAGPNGAGKSTLYQTRVAPSFAGPFINADLIQRDELGDTSMEVSYRAAAIAEERRTKLLEDRKSFATETVFSHPSKLDLLAAARERGYIIVVLHVGVGDPELSVARVKGRAAEGGHDVPEDKIRARFDRGQPLIRQAVLRADRGMVFDNSVLNEPPRLVLLFAGGRPVQAEAILPNWVLTSYTDDLLI